MSERKSRCLRFLRLFNALLVRQSKPWEQAPTRQNMQQAVAKNKDRVGQRKASATNGWRKTRAKLASNA